MKKFQLSLLFPLFLLLSCERVTERQELRLEGVGVEKLDPAVHKVDFPTPDDARLVEAKNFTTPGTYSLVSFRGYIVDTKHNTRAYFSRTLADRASIQEKDNLELRADWSLYNGLEVLKLGSELNLPFEVLGSVDGLVLKSFHYYWNEVASDDTWHVRFFKDESPAGIQLRDIFSSKDKLPAVGSGSVTNMKDPWIDKMDDPKLYKKEFVKNNKNDSNAILANARAVVAAIPSADSPSEIILYYQLSLTKDVTLTLESVYKR